MLKILEEFHCRLAIRITGITEQHKTGGEWEWLPVDEALETTGIWPIKEFIQRR